IPISACFTMATICSTENRLRFIRQNPPSSDFAENSLSNWINFRGADQLSRPEILHGVEKGGRVAYL
ncbi:MAG TPA: hypothetical protein VJP02_13415, partial [Candidatus Sulfotelmatobacter sp.]|nr:hypothetical protein [Candidatus Sulfotelmatobacter sp.]